MNTLSSGFPYGAKDSPTEASVICRVNNLVWLRTFQRCTALSPFPSVGLQMQVRARESSRGCGNVDAGVKTD